MIVAFQDPIVEEHRQHLLHEQRVAFGRLHDLRPHLCVEVGGAQEVLGHLHTLVLGQWLQDEDPMPLGFLAPIGVGVEEVGTCGAGQHHGHAGQSRGDGSDQVEERPLGPVDVVDQYQ